MTALHSEGRGAGEQGCKTRQWWFLHSLVKKITISFSLSQLENCRPHVSFLLRNSDAFWKQSLVKSKRYKTNCFLMLSFSPFFFFLHEYRGQHWSWQKEVSTGPEKWIKRQPSKMWSHGKHPWLNSPSWKQIRLPACSIPLFQSDTSKRTHSWVPVLTNAWAAFTGTR